MNQFIDRTAEMSALEKEYQRPGFSFVVVYGRRRVGKTTLINEFCKNKRHIYFLATEENESQNRAAFQNAVAEETNNTLLQNTTAENWSILFDELAKSAKDSRLIIVIDEFQYLGKSNPAFPSVLMKICDEILRSSNIMLIICGSLIRMMTDQVLHYDSPLYGRRTAQIRMKQIPFSYYHDFFRKMSFEDQVMNYAVTGGVPKYIELFQEHGDIYAAIEENILNVNSFLYAEPEFLLRKEVAEIGNYFSLLKVIAGGNHKLSNICSRMGIKQTSASVYLKTLTELDIIQREVPVTEHNPEKSKMGQYLIKDNFLKFWFQFVYPNMGLLEAGRTKYVLEKIKKQFVANHVSYVYEDICRERIWSDMEGKVSFTNVGRWWNNKDAEFDIVTTDLESDQMVIGECKYSGSPKDRDTLLKLKEKVSLTGITKGKEVFYVLYSRSGYTRQLLSLADTDDHLFLFKP